MVDKEGIRDLLSSLAGSFDELADEYEQRIKDYSEALETVNDAIREVADDTQAVESPDGMMSDFLMEQDDFQEQLEDAFPDGLREGVNADAGAVRSALLRARRIQDMRESIDESLDSPEHNGLLRSLEDTRDIIDTALTECKADYARLLENMETIGTIWDMTE